jgi:Cys-rich four helix bundle protein (predicted Tat secretion target)
MERRDFFAGLGAAVALSAATPALAQAPEPSRAHGEGHGMQDHGAHEHPPQFAALKESSARCVSTGNDCLRHCFGMLAMNDTRMVACTRSVYDLVHACVALETLAAVNSPHTRVLAKAVGEICTACETECAKFPDIAECRACRSACQTCAAECRKIAA